MKTLVRIITLTGIFTPLIFIPTIISSCNSADKDNSFTISSPEARWPLIEIENVTHHTVFKEEGSYASFPSLAINPSNDYLYTMFNVKDAVSHHHTADERTVTMESRDGGVTWQTIGAIPSGARDARPVRPGLISTGRDTGSLHGGAFEMPDGALVRIGHYMWRWLPVDRLPEFEGKYSITPGAENRGPGLDYFGYVSGGYLERSEDGGQTWERTEIPELDVYESCSSPWSYDQLPDGTVISAFALRRSAEDQYMNKVVAVLTRDGRTAQLVDVMGGEPGYHFTEETLVHVTGKGDIWMLTRVQDNVSERGHHNLWQAVSVDGGRSWTSGPTAINIGRSPASGLVQLDDGRLLLVAGHRRPLYGIHALVSEDEGLTWHHDRRISLRQDGHGFDLGYARAVKLSDGSVVTIYYYSTAEEVATEGITTRSIIATRFRVPDLNYYKTN